MSTRVVVIIAALMLVAGGSFAASPSVSAHADYESSTPAANEVVAESPAQVDVLFTQDLVKIEGQFYVRVLDAEGTQLAGDGEVDDDNRRHVSTVLPEPLAEGLYVVQWFTTSDEDSETDEGSFCFSVVEPMPDPLPEACQEEPHEPAATLAAETATAAPDSTPDTGEPTPAPTAGDHVEPDDGTSTAVIVGVIVGVVVAVLVIGGAAVGWFRRSQG